MVVRIVSVPSMETFEPCDCSKWDVNGDPTIEFWPCPGTEQRGRKNKQHYEVGSLCQRNVLYLEP